MKPVRGFAAACAGLLFVLIATLHAQSASPADSLPPAFQQDSSKAATIRDLEAGKTPEDRRRDSVRTASVSHGDSLEAKLHRRHPFFGVTLSAAFADLSAKEKFAAHLNALATRDTLALLQPLDPVSLYVPFGLVASVPVFEHVDLWLRTESFWYEVTGLTRDRTLTTREYGYGVRGNLVGAGARFLVPLTLLSINGHSGLYTSYTHFWNLDAGLHSNDGSVRAKRDAAGAGYEIQAGYQHDFDKRWEWNGALAFSSFSFKSDSPWTAIIPDGSSDPVSWNLRSLRLYAQFFYQFGTRGR